jgi:hypothetical protein
MFLIAALGFLVKYQIVLLFLTILMLSLTVKSYRFIFRRSATYIGLFLFVIVISPHIFWLVTNDNSAVEYALSARRATGALELFLSLNDLLVGFLTICVSAILVIGAARLLRFDISFNNPSFEVMILAIGPIFFLVIGAFVTGQDIRQGWMLPMTTTVVLGIALCVEIKFKDLRASHLLFTTLGVAALNNALLFGFIEVKAAMGKPIEAFDFDAKPIAERVDALWREISSKPLHCIVVDSRRSSHVVLWLPSRPKVINVGDPYWSTPRQIKDCLADGGIAVLHENTEQVNAQRFCLKKEVETSASSAINKQALFPQLDLFYVSTRGEGGQCGE